MSIAKTPVNKGLYVVKSKDGLIHEIEADSVAATGNAIFLNDGDKIAAVFFEGVIWWKVIPMEKSC